jgi:YHS domain-containing protein
MKTRWIVISLGVAMLLAAGKLTASEEETAIKEFAATCPVSGKPAIESSFVELPKGGGKVYFCCTNCPKAYQANPEKYELKVRRQLLETGQIVQVACPVSGQAVDEETMVDVGHAKAGFCCEKCLAKYNASDDEGKLKILFADLKKGFTRQTRCPVSGKPINPQESVEYMGEKVYFCCPNCPGAFQANPEKFMAKLPQFSDNNGVESQN